MKNKIPIARCPNCGRTVLYSDDPRDKLTVTVRSDCYGMDYEFEDIGSFCDKNKSEMVAL